MRILFVELYAKSTEPMSIMLLSALAKQKRHQTFLHILSQGDLREALEKIKPDIVAYSAMTGDHRYFLQANKIAKDYNKNIFTIMGGRHPTFFPEIISNSDLNAICVGEGDDAWPELLEVLENCGNVNEIRNIITRDNFSDFTARGGGDFYNFRNIRPRKKNLDDLPYLDYALFYDKVSFGPKRTIMASRGCPFHCTYCFNRRYNHLYGKTIVSRYSVNRICEEANFIKKNWPETRFIKFYDDNFTLKADEWLEEFSERWPKEVGLSFFCLIRANIVAGQPKILELLKKAGIHSLSMSVEAGNDYIRNKIFERNMDQKVLEKAFQMAWDLDIPTFSNTILGIPVTKEEEKSFNLPNSLERDIESVDANIKLKSTIAEYPILFPYPGTAIGEYCIKNGFLQRKDFESFTVSYQNKSPLNCFTSKEKMMQQNLSMFGSVISVFAGDRNGFVRKLANPLKWLTINCLIKLPLTKLYLIFYVLAISYLYQAKIYRSDAFSWTGWLKNIPKLLRLNYFKQFEKPKK